MTRRTASKMMPPTWNRNPMRTKRISPKEARTTPMTMKETLKRTRMFGCEVPIAQPASKTATGVVAYSIGLVFV